jgi:hypothetical protein
MFQFMNWLFDSKYAWENTIHDPRFRYDMTLSEFMSIYQEYRQRAKTSD